MNKPKRRELIYRTKPAEDYDADDMDQWLTEEVLPVLRDAKEASQYRGNEEDIAWENLVTLIQQITEGT